MDIRIAEDVRDLIRLGVMELADCTVGPSEQPFAGCMAERERELRESWALREPGAIPELQPARRLYRAARLDPTRNRPSSEALVRRILRGGSLPRINNAVDLCNLSAVTYFLSIGLYDLGKLEAPLEVGLGGQGERYQGLGKPEVHLEGRLCIRDRLGPFGNPSSDSLRSSVGPGTTRLLWVVYAPVDYPLERLERHLSWSADLARTYGLGRKTGPLLLIPDR